MEIFYVWDFRDGKEYYFVPDATTQTEGQNLNNPNATFTIGTEQDAINFLTPIRDAWVSTRLDYVTVCKVEINENEHQVWQACDLNSEPENTDVIYQVFSPLTALHTEVIGLANAKQLAKDTLDAYIEFYGFASPVTYTKLPPKFTPPPVQTTGTQTV